GVALSDWLHVRVVLEGALELACAVEFERGREGALSAVDRRVRGADRGARARGVRERLAEGDRARDFQRLDGEDARRARTAERGALSAAQGDWVRAPSTRPRAVAGADSGTAARRDGAQPAIFGAGAGRRRG